MSMFWIFGKGLLGSASIVLSTILTALVLFWLWNVIAPNSPLLQLIILLLLFVFGVILFFALAFFFAAVSTIVMLLLLRRKMKKSFKKMFDMMEK
jgi:multisubunit Na+/H+ antiporter MnhE subunit